MLQNVYEDMSAVWASGSMAKSALWIMMFLHLLLHVLGQLPAPQNVNLTSENFRYIVTWEPGARSPPNTQYTVEATSLSTKAGFTPVKKCNNITTLSCDLSQTFKSPSDLYWVQVKSVTSTSESEWVVSKELQPNRDTILGPPIINVSSNKQTIEVTLDMPLTPHKRVDNGKIKTVYDIAPSLTYIVTLLDKDDQLSARKEIKPDESGKGNHRFENLKPKMKYCVVAKLKSTYDRLKDSAKICKTTSPQNTNILWIAPLIAVVVFIAGTIFVGFVVLMLKEFTCLHLNRSQLPKSLAIIYEDLHVTLHCQELDENPEGDHISFITHNDCSDDYKQKCQSTDLATKVQLTSLNCITDTDERIFYRSDGYESNSLMKETDVCTYRAAGGLPSYLQTSAENRGSTSSTQQINPGVPVSYNLQYQQFSSLKDTEETRSSNVAESVPTLQTVHHDFGTFQEIKTEITEIELWKCADIPLSSVKLFFNVDTEKDNSEVGTCEDGASDLLSTDDLSSQFTCDLTAATDQIGIQEYQAQSLKLPQFLNDYKLQNLGQKPSFHISEPECMQFSEYEAH